MTTIDTTYTPNPFGKLLIFGLVLALAVGAFGVMLHGHAVAQHGQDAVAVRRCLNDSGPHMIFKASFGDTWYLLCQIDPSRWGIQAVTKNGHEKTAFVPGDGSPKAVLEYLQRIATRWTKPLPWLR